MNSNPVPSIELWNRSCVAMNLSSNDTDVGMTLQLGGTRALAGYYLPVLLILNVYYLYQGGYGLLRFVCLSVCFLAG